MNEKMSPGTVSPGRFCLLTAAAMTVGWGIRGDIGHERGAMLAGALLGMALALGSGRKDWQRRTLVAGLFGALGWAWYGTVSIMEHTLYIVSDSFPDVLYGYAALFFLGGLTGGCAGAGLGLALTEPRSSLDRIVRALTATAATLFLSDLYWFFFPEQLETLELFAQNHLHGVDWLPATLAMIAGAVYGVVRPGDRPAAALIFRCAAGWWAGYLILTQWGGLLLAPPNRSESWGGVVGVLVVLMIHLKSRSNRAALLFCQYGILAGGLAFVAGFMLRHPVWMRWGMFTLLPEGLHLKVAEFAIGGILGPGFAWGTWRLLRGGLAFPEEDCPREPLDVASAAALFIVLMWMCFQEPYMAWTRRAEDILLSSPMGVPLWVWYGLGGLLASVPALILLCRYYRGDRTFVPSTAYGKGVMAFLLFLLLVNTLKMAKHMQLALAVETRGMILYEYEVYWLCSAMAACLALTGMRFKPPAPAADGSVAASDPRWRAGLGYVALWGLTPLLLLGATAANMGLQEGSHDWGRRRFGPGAHWRQVQGMPGLWKPVSLVSDLAESGRREEPPPIRSMEFSPQGDATLTMADGSRLEGVHRWTLENPFFRLHWYGRIPGHPERDRLTLRFKDHRLFVPWPPAPPVRDGGSGLRSNLTDNEGRLYYIVFEKVPAGVRLPRRIREDNASK